LKYQIMKMSHFAKESYNLLRLTLLTLTETCTLYKVRLKMILDFFACKFRTEVLIAISELALVKETRKRKVYLKR